MFLELLPVPLDQKRLYEELATASSSCRESTSPAFHGGHRGVDRTALTRAGPDTPFKSQQMSYCRNPAKQRFRLAFVDLDWVKES